MTAGGGLSQLKRIPPLWLAMAAATAVYLALLSRVPLAALAGAAHDDALFVRLAEHILQGRWLGPYDNLTLAKGPFYSAWLAALHLLGLPLILSQAALYAGAGWLWIAVLRPHAPRPALLFALFAVYLFNPMVYDVGSLRVLREGLYVPLMSLVLAMAAAWWQARRKPGLGPWLWSFLLGAGLAAFWLTREEGPALAPALLILAGAALFRDRTSRPAWLKSLALAAAAAAAAWGGVGIVRWLNYRSYGVWDVVEFKQKEFMSAYGALSRVRPAQTAKPHVVVPREVLDRAFAASPSFAGLRGRFKMGWAEAGCRTEGLYPCDGEFRGGSFMWALRDAVADAGHYASASAARGYYARLAAEIDEACAAGRLDCLPPRASLTAPLRPGDWRRIAASLGRAVAGTVLMRGLDIRAGRSQGEARRYEDFRGLVVGRFFPLSARWTFQGEAVLPLLADGRAEFLYPGDAPYFRLQQSFGPGSDRRPRIRFDLETECLDESCALGIRRPRAGLTRFPVPELLQGKAMERDGVRLTVRVERKAGGMIAGDAYEGGWLFVLLRAVGRIYRWSLPAAALIALASYLWSWRRRRDFLWLMSTTLLAAAASRWALLSYMDATAFPLLAGVYLSPIHPLLILFCGIAVIDALS